MSGPVEVKVSAATIASAVSGLGLWALQQYVFRADVPLPVVAAVTTVVPAAITFVAGWLAPHTPRPDLNEVRIAPPPGGVWVAGQSLVPGDEVADPDDLAPSGRHVLDDEPDDIPVSDFTNPAATHRHLQD